MLQPRKRKFTLKITPKGLLLCVIILLTFTQNLDYVKGDEERNGLIKEKIKRGERVIRHGDVNIVVLDDFDRRKLTPSLGLLSTTARTFIQEGTTTEYATHIYGTTVGDKYAHIVSTGSKIFYDNIRPSKDRFDPIITIPSLDLLLSEENDVIVPTKVTKIHINTEKVVIPNKEDNLHKNFDSLKANIPSISEKTPVTVNRQQSSSSEEKKSNFISIKKEISIKPARVKLRNELPTFTVKQDGVEVDLRVDNSFHPEVEDNSIRSAKNIMHKPVAKTPELTTTTYFGFADFITTAGNTVIIFTPKTKKPHYEGAVTSIQGEPTISGIPLSTAVFSLPSTTPDTTESAEEVTQPPSKEEEVTTVKELKTEEELEEIETTPEIPEVTTEPIEVTTENIISSTNVDDLVKHNLDVPLIENNDSLESSFAQDISPTSATDVYKTLTYVTTFYLSSENGQTGTSIRSDTVLLPQSTEEVTTEGTTPAGTTELDEDISTERFDDDTTTTESTTEKAAIKYKIYESTAKTDKPKLEDMVNNTDAPKTEAPIKNQTEKLQETTEPATTTSEELKEEVISTTPDPDNVEVELVFKTIYTTFTYLTTYFEKSTTKVKSREEVVTNVVSSTLDNSFWQLASDPAIAELFSSTQGFKRGGKVLPTSVQVDKPTSSVVSNYNEVASSSIADLDNEITKPTPTLESYLVQSSVKTKLSTYKSFSTVNNDGKTAIISNTNANSVNLSSSEVSKTISESGPPKSKEQLPFRSVLRHYSPANSYKTTIKRIKSSTVESPDVQETKTLMKNDTKNGREAVISNEIPSNSVIISAPLTNNVSKLVSTKKSTEQTPKKVYLENDNDDDQLSLESNTEETHPNPSLISLQTSYTTYTYFTTLYTGTTSIVVSRLETVTNVNTELIKPSSTEATQIEEATAPVTYYTTYTYWTTFYKDGSTMIKSRQETVSNVPQTTSSSSQSLKTEVTPTVSSTKEPFSEPVTYYTTFTYFTTSYIDNSSVVNSHLETVTNVIDATKAAELLDENTFQSTDRPVFQATGLIASALDTSVNNNQTTVFSTNVYGTYVDGVYSQYAESTSSIVTSPIVELPPAIVEVKPTGLVSVNEGKIVDAFNVSTTLYTTKVIGTYIGELYAQSIESSSSVIINTEKLTNLVNPETVVLHNKIYQTGVLQLTSGSIVQDKTTTFYETKVIGSVVNDQYSSITASSSSVYVEIQPTKTTAITATATANLSAAPPSILSSTSPSPAVIESSFNENSNENESEEDKDKTRRKSFTPVIRPFASRSRPSFLPKKKTTESLSAATITRGYTPTIVATPAAKPTESRVFGSASRNRFASSRKSSVANTPSSELRPASASSRRYSKGKSISVTSFAPTSSSSFGRSASTKGFSSSVVSPNFKRGSYRPTSSASRSVDYLSSSPGGSRFRIRPSASARIASFTPSTTPRQLEEAESSELGVTEQALSSSDEEVVEALPPTTTELSRRSNPLLRFRKPSPPRSSTPITPTQKPSTTRKPPPKNTNDKRLNSKTSTTTKPPRPRTPSSINNRLRSKPNNGLFPSKPPLRKPELESESVEETSEQEVKQEQTDSIEEITESLEAINANSITERSTRRAPAVSIKPFNRRGRIKRQAEFGYKYENIRGQSSRYRRPTQNSFPDYLYYDDAEYTTEDYSIRSVNNRNNFKSRNSQQVPLQQQQPQQQTYQQYQQSFQQPFQYQQNYQSTTPAQVYQSPKIRPSTTTPANSRAQFTLREKTQVTTAAPQRSNRRTTSAPTHRKSLETATKRSSRLRTYTTTTEVSLYRNNRKQSTSRRTPSRSRYKDNDYNANTYSAVFDGTITVTHEVPTEVTIPVFNGKVTEFKNVITAKPSLQTLAPHQYSTITGKNGATSLQLVNELTETLLNGATEVTRFVIQEIPTSSLMYTPTTIRGRKTSVSHFVPTTAYKIKPEISTILPQLNANAPLANLLLSQLLLGNLGLQPTINPLLGLTQASTAPPVTEYKTKTTTYVTTITHSTSTIIPVTFRGKEIKTTVIDSSTQVITATEFITESVVISPTASAAPTNQFNTLLLPALLQAQLLNQPLTTSTTGIPIDENVDNLQNIQDSPTPSKVVKNEDEDVYRKKQKGNKFDSQIEPAAETSVVTLYLTGRRPGEFSTVFSTVTLDDKSATLRKRNADAYDISPSVIPSVTATFDYDDDFDDIIKSGINEISPSESNQETQSLDSIVGNYGQRILHEKTQAPLKDEKLKKNHFLLKTSTESAPFRWNSNLKRSLDQRYEENDTSNSKDSDGIKSGRKLLSVDYLNDIQNVEDDISQDDSDEWSNSINFGRKLLSIDDSNDMEENDENGLSQDDSDEWSYGVNFGRKLLSVDDSEDWKIDEDELSQDDTEWSYGTNVDRKLLSTDVSDDVAKDVHNSVNVTLNFNHDNESVPVEDEGRGRYNLATKVMSNGVEVIVALDKSTLPGSPQLLRVLPTSNIRPITLTPSTLTDHMIMMLPHGLQDTPNPLVTKTYVTTYTYLTTLLQEGQTTTSSNEKVVSNVLTENANVVLNTSPNADAHVTLSSSPILATKVLQTTYKMESTVTNDDVPHVVTSQQTVSNTITAPGGEYVSQLQPSEPSFIESNSIPTKETPNEDYSIKPTEKLTTNAHVKHEKNTIEVKPTSLQAVDVTKTYLVTYTYLSTLLENGTTVVKSNIATSSDVVTEKSYIRLSRTKHPANKSTQSSITPTEVEKPISIFATKTYLTTFTYYTTLLQEKGDKGPQTVTRSRTKVMQNLVTETLNTNLLNPEYLSSLKLSLSKESAPITATATLNDGQRLEITAINDNVQSNTIDRISSSIEESQDYYNQVDNQPVKHEDAPKPATISSKSKEAANFSTTVLHSPTVMKNGATLYPGSQVIKFTDTKGNVSIIPVSDPVSKHPAGNHKPDTNKIQMNNLLNFGNLGINSLSALKPVINAMAGLWQNNIKSNVKDKNHEVHYKIERPHVDKNPLAELSTNLKPPNRTPIYIPVGSVNDNEEAESEDLPEQYPDVNQRNNHNHITLGKPAVEKPLVSGGISISPGQVITTNTDVIVGTPAVLGPRPPPVKTSNDKSDVPIGMKPPPLQLPHYSDEEFDKSPHQQYGEFLKIPPKPLSPAFLNSGFQNGFQKPPSKHHYKNTDQKIPLPSEIKYSQLPLNSPLHKDPIKEQNPYPPVKLPHPVLIEHSSLNPLLVNVRPSQVAQVVIPHGSQTALIYNDEPSTYSTKGEIFNDPSPYPEENVNPGFVGLKVYGPANTPQESASKLSNTIHLDIPINPYANDGALTESHHFIVLGSDGKPQPPYNIVNSVLKAPQNETIDGGFFKRPNSKYNFTVPSNVEFIKKPNRPTWHQNHPNLVHPSVTEHNQQRPFIFPQANRPYSGEQHHHPVHEHQNHGSHEHQNHGPHEHQNHGSHEYQGHPIHDHQGYGSHEHQGHPIREHQNYGSHEHQGHPGHEHQNENNLVIGDSENDQSNDHDESSHQDDDELTQETKLKPNNQHSNEISPSATITVSAGGAGENDGSAGIKHSNEDVSHDYEINQNWEIMKENPQGVKPTKPTHIPGKLPSGDNSTTRENPNIKYSEWTTMDFPIYSSDVNVTSHPQVDANSIANQEKENSSANKNGNQKQSSNNRNNQDDVIGLSPPPPPSRPSIAPQKPTRPSLKPYEQPKVPQRPPQPAKNKPKPTNPPYPFEKPTPTPVSPRPKPINRPPPNILYETDAPHLADELMKMKPLNSTGRIEPVKKWPTTSKPTGSQPVYGNVIKVTDFDKINEPVSSKSNASDADGSQSDTKVIVVDKPDQNTDKTTELISKWNENGVISSSKPDYDDIEYKNTPTLIPTNRTKASTVPNTIFGNLYTRPPPANIVIIPTHSTTQHYTAISMVIDQKPVNQSSRMTQEASAKPEIKPTSAIPDGQTKDDARFKEDIDIKSTPIPTYYITHTKTPTVTITETTVVERDGKPSTTTIVSTKTSTTVLIETVTKVETLLQPTKILSTITTTVPVTIPGPSVTPTDYPSISSAGREDDNESIFVVMSDKKSGGGSIAPAPTEPRPTSFEVQVPDEANEISPNDILYSGIYTQHNDNECRPECKIAKNEVCQKIDNTMRCMCRPGFARMFPDHPCKPTYTYVMKMPLDRQGEEHIRFTDTLADRTSPSHHQLTEAARDGLDRMVMQSNLRDIYHGVIVSGFEPSKESDKASVVYMVQLSENPEQVKILEEVHKTLKANNFSLGGTDVFAAPDMFHSIQADDFDECGDNKYHDCSEHAQCFNLRGTYTCSCKEGFTDVSYNTQFPGRVCSADAIGCELCNYHGTCYYKANEDPTCECFQWFAGEFCQINLKVTLISLIAIGVLLSILLVVCVVMTCNKQKPPEILRTAPKPHVGFRRYRSVTNVPGDKRAIVSVDTSSEGSIERTPPPFIKQRVLRNEPPPNAPPSSSHGGGGTVHSAEQRDRSLTVLIPRAKYRPASQPSSTLLTMSTFGPEQKLLNYAASRESSRTPEKKMSRCSMHSRRLSNSTNFSAEPQPRKKMSAPRRPSSGALVSAGFEVSATVSRTQELDEAYISQSHNDLNQPTYNSIRTAESSIIVDVPSLPVFATSFEDFITRVDKLGTVSEARSYDETTIQPPVRSLHHVFHSQTHTCGSKNSSSQKTNVDEHHTMGERDLGSTYMPKSQLYKPDIRESDGSNFDSL